jgi:hypothetical protein
MIRTRLVIPALVLLCLLFCSASAQAGFGLKAGSPSITFENQDGTLDSQAGSHPYAFSVHFALNTEGEGSTAGGVMRDVLTDLPAGLFGNPTAVPACPRESFEGAQPSCNPSTQVGLLKVLLPELKGLFTGPLYNLVPPPGVAAQFGFTKVGFTALLSATISPGNGYRIHIESANLPLEASSITALVWGTPADPAHDSERGTEGAEPSAAPVLPFLTLPTSCESPPQVNFLLDSRFAPGLFVGGDEPALLRDRGGNPLPLTGCESVPFSPSVSAAPTASSVEAPTGLNFVLRLPNQGLLSPKEGSVTETEPQSTEVVLPPGITVNPSAANGMVGCSEHQYAEATGEPGTGCPEASKVGTLVAKTPLLDEPIEGAVYLALPKENPSESLLALYIVAKTKERGVLIKQAGKVEADRFTGQLTTTFDQLPPLPYSTFEFELREGPRAPLITPQSCGEYTTTARLYPFSDPAAATTRTVPFEVTSGSGGAGCVSGESQMPAHPTLEAGTTTPLGGLYSPFVFRVKRSDGEQRFSSISATLPAGLLGRIAGIPYCPESGIAQAASRNQEGDGAVENSQPSCPSSTQVGTVNVAAGAGSQPYYVQGKAYLAGPYKGAPLSLEIITPAVAGPFDLGAVAVRTALYVDESTAEIHAVSDLLPTILHGIPLDVRAVSLQMDRKEFTLNPTNCEAKQVTGSVTTLSGAVAHLSNSFAVGGCQGLAFQPTLKLAFSGQTKRTGNPAVKAVLTQPAGWNANVAGATVILPKGMFIDQAHINSPCTRVQFNATTVPGGGCPASSILGTAKAWSPLLEGPEGGNVYFRSNGGERELPDLVVALRGQIPLQLVGFVDSVGRKHAEVRRVRSRFLNLPDAPVSRFELNLSGGKKGLLENSKNLCQAKDVAKFELIGQNGKTHDTEPKVQVSCGKKSAGKK